MGLRALRMGALAVAVAGCLGLGGLSAIDSAQATPTSATAAAPASGAVLASTSTARARGGPRLAIRLAGLPSAAQARVVVTGARGYRRVLAHSGTVVLPKSGRYLIGASAVVWHTRTYVPVQRRQVVSVRRGSVKRVGIGYRIRSTPTQPTTPITVGHIPGGISTARYDIGDIEVRDVWVDGALGADGNDGSQARPLRTVARAWASIPASQQLTTGIRIQVRAGRYSESMTPNYWENRWGSAAHPIILNAVDGAHTVRFDADINMYATRYFYLIGVDIIRDQDAFHCELCDHVLLRSVELDGNANSGDGSASHDLLKVNQSQYIYVEDSQVHGAEDNAIDFVAVQSGHIVGSTVYSAGDWCGYAKGGSAYLNVADNEFYDCGVGGFTAGQGTGFEFMASPWITYEAMGIRVVNNVIHDTANAGLGVQGGYNVLLAYNTLYRVGEVDSLLLVQQGSRSCDSYDAGASTAACTANLNRGGWGTATTGGEWIPNRHVYVFNNVIYNPAGFASRWQQLSVHGPAAPPDWSNIAAPAAADRDLRIEGNVIWNGPVDLPLGVGDGSGCADSNATCNQVQLLADNQVNSLRPEFVDAPGHDFRPVGAVAGLTAAAIPDFDWADATSGVPAGATSNVVDQVRTGQQRAGWGRPGAY